MSQVGNSIKSVRSEWNMPLDGRFEVLFILLSLQTLQDTGQSFPWDAEKPFGIYLIT